jgi:hypothetical protein
MATPRTRSHDDNVARIRKMLTGSIGKQIDRASAINTALPETLRHKESRRAAAKALGAVVDRSTQRQLGDIMANDQAALQAALETSKAAAMKGSRGALKILNAAAAARVKGLAALPAVPTTGGTPQYDLQNTPFLIWPTNSVDLEASEIIPANSFAKFRTRIGTHKSFYGDVKFYYLWTNPNNKFALININGYVIFNGHCSVGVGGGNFPGDRSATVGLTGALQIFEWWNQPPTSPPSQPDESVDALHLRVTAFGWGEAGAVDARNFFRGFDLSHTLMIVPPFGTVVVAVTARVVCGTGEDSGNAEADFASAGFQVGSPAVLFTILS